MSSRCSRRKCQPSGPKWGEVLPLQPDNKDLIQLALLHQWAACRLAVMEWAIDTAEYTLSYLETHSRRPDPHRPSTSLCSLSPMLSLTHLNTHLHIHTQKHIPLNHWAVQTLYSAYTSPTLTMTLSANRTTHIPHPPYKLKSFQLLFFHVLDFLFSTSSALHPLLYQTLPPLHFALLLWSSSMLARTVGIVTVSPYFQPFTALCPVGYCPVGIWCSRSQIQGVWKAHRGILFRIKSSFYIWNLV